MPTRSLLLVALAVVPAFAAPPRGIRLSDGRFVPLPAREPTKLSEKVDPGQHYLARPLDQAGRLAEALPLYRARADATRTNADRLRYAGALLRAGRYDEAKRVYDELVEEGRSHAHGQPSANLVLCASNMLMEGFPEVAVAYLRPAYRSDAGDRRLALLFARALVAAGDAPGARRVIADVSRGLDGWQDTERVELARSHLLAGDENAAKALLNREYPATLDQFVRDSILADVSVRAGDWATVAKVLAGAKRKGPSTLNEERVNRMWRNLQRELRWMELRLALALWKQGRTDDAVEEARRAAMSDEEYVRSAALMLVVSGDLAGRRRPEAVKRLKALAGHDRRFAAGVEQLARALAAGRDATDGITALRDALASQNRAADFVTPAIFDVLREAARRVPTETAARARSAEDGPPAP